MTNVIIGAFIALVGGYLFRLLEARSRLTNSIRLFVTELDAISDNLETKGLEELQPQLEKSTSDYRLLIRDVDPICFEEHRALYGKLYEAVVLHKLDFQGTLNILLRIRHLLMTSALRPGDPDPGPPPVRDEPPTNCEDRSD